MLEISHLPESDLMSRQAPITWLWFGFDVSIAVLATLACLLLKNAATTTSSLVDVLAMRISVKNFVLLTIFLVLWTGIHHLSGLHVDPSKLPNRSALLRSAFASAFGSVFFLLFPLFSREESSILLPVFLFFAVALSASLCTRSLLWSLPSRVFKNAARPLRTVIIGSGPLALRLYESLIAAGPNRYDVLGFVDSPAQHVVPEVIADALLGPLTGLETILMATPVDEVLIALPLRSCYDRIQQTIKTCERAGVPAAYNYQPFQHSLGYLQVEERALMPYMSWHPSRIAESEWQKRSVDVVLSVIAVVFLAPVFLVIAIAIKLTSPGPAFFIQERFGLNKRRFRMYKFRTMIVDAEARQTALEQLNEAQGPVFKMKQDPRVTPVGRFLRKTSLDELPQLFNVLKGDMSLVGPRPLPNRDVTRFSESWLMRRFSVKPGLTCLWQVQGRSNTSFDEWIALDLQYIDTWSHLLDLKILALTIPAVMRGNGAM
jgi:exopolysaccharide biosynthesis polyprenyl glycosylphosphotransferase